jgi:molybdate transport system ATP-binding protein
MNQGVKVTFQKHLENVEMNVDFIAPSHGITAIFGRSGAGKTSIVNAVSGLLSPDTGKIVVNGRTVFDSTQGTNIAVPRTKAFSSLHGSGKSKLWRQRKRR